MTISRDIAMINGAVYRESKNIHAHVMNGGLTEKIRNFKNVNEHGVNIVHLRSRFTTVKLPKNNDLRNSTGNHRLVVTTLRNTWEPLQRDGNPLVDDTMKLIS